MEKYDFILGDEIVGATPINPSRDLLSVENGRLKVTSASYAPDLGFYIRGLSIPKTHKVYLYANLDFPSTQTQNIAIRATVPGITTLLNATFSNDGNSQLTTTNADLSNFYITLNGTKNQGEHYYFVNSIIIMDLTDTFGAGKEPSKAVMDYLVAKYGYFDEIIINKDDIHEFEIAQIKQAVLQMGGTL